MELIDIPDDIIQIIVFNTHFRFVIDYVLTSTINVEYTQLFDNFNSHSYLQTTDPRCSQGVNRILESTYWGGTS